MGYWTNPRPLETADYNSGMRKLLRFFLAAWLLLAVALVSALTAMRFAIHVREVKVPDFRGKRPAEARLLAEQNGLGVQVETNYYSATVPEGRVLSQGPGPGSVVRRGFEVQLALSLGPQRITIPELVGESGRAAAITIADRGFELTSADRIELPLVDTGEVVAQNPAANETDISAPRISLLVADEKALQAFVMPSFLGERLETVRETLASAGFSLGKVTVASPGPSQAASPAADPGEKSGPGASPPQPSSETPATAAPQASIVVSQEPAPGSKVLAGSSINLVVK